MAWVGLCSNHPVFAFTYGNQDRASNRENRFFVLILKGQNTWHSHQLVPVLVLYMSWLIKVREFPRSGIKQRSFVVKIFCTWNVLKLG